MGLGSVQGNITIHQDTRTIVVEQMQPLAIRPDKVVIPFDMVKTLACNIILMELGAAPMVGSPPSAGEDGKGENPEAAGEASSLLRLH